MAGCPIKYVLSNTRLVKNWCIQCDCLTYWCELILVPYHPSDKNLDLERFSYALRHSCNSVIGAWYSVQD